MGKVETNTGEGEVEEGEAKPGEITNPASATPCQNNPTPGDVKQTSTTLAITPELQQAAQDEEKTYKARFTIANERAINLQKELDNTRQELNAEREAFAKEKATFNEKMNRAERMEFETNVSTIASSQNVDANTLMEQAKALGLTDKAKIEAIAAIMPKRAAMHIPDSGKTIGGHGFNDMSTAEKIRYGMEHPEARM